MELEGTFDKGVSEEIIEGKTFIYPITDIDRYITVTVKVERTHRDVIELSDDDDKK